jgi:monoterpene epsilon-lactone hydrolase
MASTQSAILAEYYRRSNAVAAMDPPLPLPELRDRDEHWGDVAAEPRGVDYLEVDVGGVPAMWIAPHGAGPDRVLLCLHGGGFIGGSMYTHRKLFGHLAKAVGVRALSVDYRRMPEYQYPAPYDDATAAYRWLVEKEGIGADRIAFAGDSAGACLALATALRARGEERPMPAALLLLSPWVDLAGTGETLTTNRGSDILFGGERPMDVHGLVRMFLAGAAQPTEPAVSPLYADLTGLPPAYLQVGSAEMLLDDSRRFAEVAELAGVDVELDVVPEMQHTFQMMAGRAPEADAAISRLAAWPRPRLGMIGPDLRAGEPA